MSVNISDRTDPTIVSNYLKFPYVVQPTKWQQTAAKVTAIVAHVLLGLLTLGIFSFISFAKYRADVLKSSVETFPNNLPNNLPNNVSSNNDSVLRGIQPITPKANKPAISNEIEIDRIISRHPLAANFPELGMKEMQVLERRLEEVFIDEEIQEGYSSGTHPGIAFVDWHDVDPSILAPKIDRIYDGYIYKTLLYMLLEGRIHFVAKARCGFCVGLEPLDQVDIKRYEFSKVYQKEDLLRIERFIKENTISTPENTPADIITIVDLVVKEINEKLFNRVAYKREGIIVLKSEDLYKLNFGSESFVLAKKALNFLVNSNIIHSWNTHGNSKYGYCVRLDANDEINPDSSIYSHEWKDITNIN